MEKDLIEIERQIKEFVNKYNVKEITILIDDLWKHKTVTIILK